MIVIARYSCSVKIKRIISCENVIFDKETTTELIDIFEEDKTQSNLLTREMYKERGLFKRFIGWFAHLFTPFL